MKDESEVKLIGEFVGFKSKMHSIKNTNGKESNAAKGVDIAIEFNEFKGTLFNKKIIKHKIRRIQGKKHKIGKYYKINKISLSVFDSKRYVLNDGMHMLPYFHKDTLKNRFTQMIISKKRFSKRFSKMVTNKNKCV